MIGDEPHPQARHRALLPSAVCFTVSDRPRDKNSSSWLQAIVRPLPAPHRHLGSGTPCGHSACIQAPSAKEPAPGVPQDPPHETPDEGATTGTSHHARLHARAGTSAANSCALAPDDEQEPRSRLLLLDQGGGQGCPPQYAARYRVGREATAARRVGSAVGATVDRGTSSVPRSGGSEPLLRLVARPTEHA
jgi:hypothetical protein